MSDFGTPFWIYAGWGATTLFIVVALVFFFGEPLKLRIMMFGRQRFGYGVIEVIHRNGRRTPHAVKFEKEIKVGNFLFRPNFHPKYMFRNEFGMPCMQFNVASIEPVDSNPANPKKGVPQEPIEVGDEYQTKANDPPKTTIVDPAEDLQSHMAFFQAGIMKGGGLAGRLEKLLWICIIASVISIGIGIFLLKHTGAF